MTEREETERCAPTAAVLGFTEQLKRICQDTCANEYGDPPCWDLPNRSSDCEGEVISPCDECVLAASALAFAHDSNTKDHQ